MRWSCHQTHLDHSQSSLSRLIASTNLAMSSTGYTPPSLNGEIGDEESQEKEALVQPLDPPVLKVAPVAKLVGTARVVQPTTTAAAPVPRDPSTDLSLTKKRILFVWLIVTSVWYGMLFLMSLGACLMSAMLFDAGISFRALMWVVLIFSIPVLLGWAVIAMWQAFGRRDYRLVVCISILPVVATLVITMYT